jgi:Protein of unknown function (DUF2917)
MNSMPMSDLHQHPFQRGPVIAPWAWCLAAHEATTLRVTHEPRWLLVNAGSVWVTQVNAVSASESPPDIWLAPGHSLCLPAGTVWVLEAWEPAELSLAMRQVRPEPRAFKRVWRGLFSRAGRAATILG